MICQAHRNRQMMTVEDFCVRLEGLGLSGAMNAVAILWFQSEHCQVESATSGDLSRVMKRSGLGNSNSTALAASLKKTGHVLCTRDRFTLKPTSREKIRVIVRPILGPEAPDVPLESEFLPRDVWKNTRGYIEKLGAQINGCYHCTFYDGASVLCRKLIEILIIEAFEHHGAASRIKDSRGEYFMLRDLISSVLDPNNLSVGREAKQVLTEVKAIGDRSAHSRRYVAVRQDLDNLRSGYRLAVDELLHLSGMK
jgi:hypothetical protein